MESLQHLKRRLKGVQNINQITKAMELVAATKMRRSQEIALASRPYALTALEFLANLSLLEEVSMPPLLTKRAVKRTAIVVVTSDKGLAGSFNSAVFRSFEKFVARAAVNLRDPAYTFIAVGQKAATYLEKRTASLKKKFTRVSDFTTIAEVIPLAETLISGYLRGTWDRVLVFSTHFKTALRQEVTLREILPVDFEILKATAREIVPETGRFAELIKEDKDFFFGEGSRRSKDYLIEPSAEAVLEDLARHLVLMQIYHFILETNASEHAARRIAMKNASDNAAELAAGLTLKYNKSRQAMITREIIEITAGAEALK